MPNKNSNNEVFNFLFTKLRSERIYFAAICEETPSILIPNKFRNTILK